VERRGQQLPPESQDTPPKPPEHAWGTSKPTTREPLLTLGMGHSQWSWAGGRPCCGFTLLQMEKEKVKFYVCHSWSQKLRNTLTKVLPFLESLCLSVSFLSFASSQPTKGTDQINHWGPEDPSAFCQPTLVPFTLRGCHLISTLRAEIIPTEALSPSPERIRTDPAASAVAGFALVSGPPQHPHVEGQSWLGPSSICDMNVCGPVASL